MARTHDSAEAAELLASGGRLRRLAHDMVIDLEAATIPRTAPMPRGMRVETLDGDEASLAIAAAGALTPTHVDFAIWAGVDRAEYWGRLLAGGGPCGPVLPAASRLIRDMDGAIAGAAIVTAMNATDWWTGDPWVPEIFVVSMYQGRGVGGLLLEHALDACARAGDKHLGLTVSQGNPARRLYERFGFQPFRSTWLIECREPQDGAHV
ncbi:MAG TPA: GNAT family N-acetyltransferase [Candidatus Saccharimonadales bacterium]|nr:GNAT family N-acetyltransferase [Candidatus Saccharimonadales bacterium]